MVGLMFGLRILLFMFCFASFAAELELHLDETNISVGEEVSLKVVVNGSRLAGFPQIPQVKNLSIESRGSSSQFQIVNGQTSVSKTFEFALTADQKGDYSIGPVSLESGGQILKSNIVKLKVGGNTNSAKAVDAKKYYYIDVDVSNKNPFLNEQIIYTFKLYRRVDLQNANVKLPDFNDFWKETLVEEKTIRKNINGATWTITEIKYALFPQKIGKLKIPSTRFSGFLIMRDRRGRRGGFGLFDDAFFNSSFGKRKKVSIGSPDLDIEVRKLPTYDGEGEFSGLVGDFSLSADVDKKQLKVGESLTLNVNLKGRGNIFDANIDLPDSNNFKSYDDKPVFSKGSDLENFSGTKIFKKALVPQIKGETQIPPVSIVVFNPKDQAFNVLKTEPIAIDVLEGDGDTGVLNLTNSGQLENKKKVKVLGKDLSTIKLKAGLLSFGLDRSLLSYLFIFSPFFILLFDFLSRKRKSLKGLNKDLYRQKDSLKKFEKNLSNVDGLGSFKLFQEFIGDLLLVDGNALTGLEITDKLREKNVSEATLARIKETIDKVEMSRFGGGNVSKSNEIQKRFLELAKIIAKEIK